MSFPEPIPDHAGWVNMSIGGLGTRLFQAQCSCKWKGLGRGRESKANDDLRKHYEEVSRKDG